MTEYSRCHPKGQGMGRGPLDPDMRDICFETACQVFLLCSTGSVVLCREPVHHLGRVIHFSESVRGHQTSREFTSPLAADWRCPELSGCSDPSLMCFGNGGQAVSQSEASSSVGEASLIILSYSSAQKISVPGLFLFLGMVRAASQCECYSAMSSSEQCYLFSCCSLVWVSGAVNAGPPAFLALSSSMCTPLFQLHSLLCILFPVSS